MPQATWNRILEELIPLQLQDQQAPPTPGQPGRFDQYRRAKIAAVEQVTKRPLIVYASACTSPKPVAPQLLMLDFTDKIGFKTVTDSIDPPQLDVLVHSPGGYSEATESIVQQLRGKYNDLRFIVPSFAKSAATMLVMSGNEILLDRDAELGPIDPQMRTPNGGTSPAVAIIELFERAQKELAQDPGKLASWMPILSQLGPSLLVDCDHAIELSSTLVKDWLKKYMFSGDPEGEQKATKISKFLGDHTYFKSHGRAVKIPDLAQLGAKVTDLRSNPALYQAVDELYCCLDIFLGNSPVYKMFENSTGGALIRQSSMQIQMPLQLIQAQQPQLQPPQTVPQPPAQAPQQS